MQQASTGLSVSGLALIGLAALGLARPTSSQDTAIGAPQVSFGFYPKVGVSPDRWSKKITWRQPDGWYSVAAHATLLPDGRIHFIGYDRSTPGPSANPDNRRSAFLMQPTPLGQAYPDEVTVTSVTQPVDADALLIQQYFVSDDLFCTGNSLTSDGRVFTAGGTRFVYDFTDGSSYIIGTSYATLFDPASDGWSRVPADMLVIANLTDPGRWYPAVTRLPNGGMLVTSGYDYVMPLQGINLSAEIFDPATGAWSILSPFGEPPLEIFNGDYSHPMVLPTIQGIYDVMVFGAAGVPVLLSTTSQPRWNLMPFPRPGTDPATPPNNGASTALLPVRLNDGEWGYANGSALVVGGTQGTSHMTYADVFDPAAPGWKARVDIGVQRNHPTSVLLPDGRVAVVAGHNAVQDTNVKRATYLDPANGLAATLGSSSTRELRGYHNVALLLPDGRVFVGSGQDSVTGNVPEKSNFRYLYPSYMFADRPVIGTAPTKVPLGQDFPMVTSGAAPDEVVLMGLGSMTHSFDFNQRYVELELKASVISGQSHLLTVGAPANSRVAPPGYYMLFVLDANRVPSIAEIVQVL